MSLTLPTSGSQAPLSPFRGAHDNILRGLEGLRELPALAAALQRARETADATLTLFDDVVHSHHGDEEQELFVSVQRSAREPDEMQRVRELVAVLVTQHRQIEALWAQARPAVARVAAGKVADAPMFAAEIDRLASLYEAHARLEEDVFLPLADTILRRDANHAEALGIAMHVRHAPPQRPYV
jgi:hemerythrin-like domain-containing protein